MLADVVPEAPPSGERQPPPRNQHTTSGGRFDALGAGKSQRQGGRLHRVLGRFPRMAPTMTKCSPRRHALCCTRSWYYGHERSTRMWRLLCA